MLNISLATILEKNRIESDAPLLLLLDIEVVNPDTGVVVEVLSVALNNEEVLYQGVTYTPTIFDISFSAESGASPKVTLSVNDYTGALQARMEAYGGGVGFNVTMNIVSSANLNQPPEITQYFQVVSARAAEYRIEWQLGAENEVLRTFPRRRQTRDFCQWQYKDANTCKYSGPLATCDYTLQGANGCGAHSNTLNFGAYPGLNQNGYVYY